MESCRNLGSPWDWRFFQTFLGITLVDSFTAYKRFCPGKADMDHTEFVLEVTSYLLNNKIGVGDSSPVLRARPDSGSDDDDDDSSGDGDDDVYLTVHDMRSLANAKYYKDATAPVLTCRECKMKCYYYCATCSDDSKPSGIVALCGQSTGRTCMTLHQQHALES